MMLAFPRSGVHRRLATSLTYRCVSSTAATSRRLSTGAAEHAMRAGTVCCFRAMHPPVAVAYGRLFLIYSRILHAMRNHDVHSDFVVHGRHMVAAVAVVECSDDRLLFAALLLRKQAVADDDDRRPGRPDPVSP